MRGLLIKDFRLLKGQTKFFVIIFIMTIFLSLNSSDNFAITYLTFICGFLAISAVGYDDNGNGMPFLLTLPVSRSLYVREKYVFGALITAIGWAAGVVITGVIGLVKGNPLPADELIFNLVWLLLWLMTMSLSLPAVLKYGTEKGKIALLASILVLVAAVYVASRFFEQMGYDIDAVIEGFSALDTLGIVALLSVLAIVMLVVSCAIATGIVRRKEY